MAGLGAHHFGGVQHGADDLSYPVQRHRLPASNKRVSSSVGLSVVSSNAFAATIRPGVQKPHCNAACSREFLLHRVQGVAVGDAFDRRDRAALGLDPEEQARAT